MLGKKKSPSRRYFRISPALYNAFLANPHWYEGDYLQDHQAQWPNVRLVSMFEKIMFLDRSKVHFSPLYFFPVFDIIALTIKQILENFWCQILWSNKPLLMLVFHDRFESFLKLFFLNNVVVFDVTVAPFIDDVAILVK